MTVMMCSKNGEYRAGTWSGIRVNEERKALLVCPDCGQLGSLEDHDIAADGVVTSSVVCAYDCGFHEHIKLKGWDK